MRPLLLLMAFLLDPRTQAGEIIEGHEVKPHSRPYMAFLRIKTVNRTRCGGFLVHENFVLTAAHCQGSFITVILGAHNIRKHEKTQQVIPVERIIPYPGYRPKVNDIMLLQLRRKAKLTAAVGLLKLPRRGQQVKPGMVCSVAGWGRVDLNTTTDKLHEVQLEIQEDRQCRARYRSSFRNDTQICVGDPKKNQSTFSGDSGGPLVCDKRAQGIVAFGKKDGKPPRVETRISSFLPWIEKTMKRFQLHRPD